MKDNPEVKLISLLADNVDFDEISCFISQYGIDFVDRDNRTILMSAVVKNNLELSDYLLKQGSNINAQDIEGMTPLHLSAIHGCYEMTKFLLENGAEVDSTDSRGNTPLWRAAMNSDSRDDQIVALFLEYGADIDKENGSGVSPRDILE